MPNSKKTPPSAVSRITPPHYGRLDALRGVAILSVIVFHAFIIRPFQGPWWMRFVGQGAQGVGLFYIVSALTLALSWQHRQTVDQFPSQAFWVRRFFRIAPVFYLMLLVSALFTTGNPTVVPASMKEHIFTWANFLTHVTFTFGWLPWFQNSWIGVEWSIGVEMTFYAIFPWLIRHLYPRLRTWQWLAIGAGSALAWPWILRHLWFAWPSWANSFLLWTFPVQLIWFGAGFAIVSLPLRPEKKHWALLWLLWAVWLGWHPWMPHAANLLWVLPNFLLVWLTWHDHPGMRILTHSRLLQWIGTRSYSLYLIHWFVLSKVSNFPWANPHTTRAFWLRLGVAFPISIALADLSYRFVEKPGIHAGKLLITHWRLGPSQRVDSQNPQNLAQRSSRA